MQKYFMRKRLQSFLFIVFLFPKRSPFFCFFEQELREASHQFKFSNIKTWSDLGQIFVQAKAVYAVSSLLSKC